MDIMDISMVLLWIVVIAQSLIIYALLRQVGILFERVAPAGALAMNQKLEVGQKAPEMSLQTINKKLINIGGSQSGKSQLVFFLSPDCPVCKTLLPALKSASKHESEWLDVVLASDGDKVDHQSFIDRSQLSAFPYVVSELLGKSFGVSKLPYAVLLDEKGMIASMGIINSREHLDSLFEAKERRVASIQDYMQGKTTENQFVEVK
ncbi:MULTISPECIES: redoxin domain-containing protein [Photobacterium]|uniref:redoxin domain-containing protein n=1 Tax=Photobacterium TaxID=657 RepID=UPI001A8FBBF0|nr:MULTISPECIES: redoxin domain-containing protein [Photobacterium]MBV1841570.1 redoxin domain-containing protein [Photobacterium ganghwense]QSV16783.1 redoxin domain-containing protein [Photobacterium ganghwense]